MQKTILLLPFLCFLSCTAQDPNQIPNGSNDWKVQPILKQSPYSCPDNYVDLTHDTQLFNQVVCVKTSIEQVTIKEGNCPRGTATVSFEEATADTQRFCKLLGNLETARIGFMGSLGGPGDGCQSIDFDSREIAHSVCVKRKINDTKLIDIDTNPCGEGQVLVTPEEALANQNDYCDLLGAYDIIRLANGGSMDGPGYGCKVRYEDRRTLGGILCRALSNNDTTKAEGIRLEIM